MIDYEKLKIAHELCQKTEKYWFRADLGIDYKDLKFELYKTVDNWEEEFEGEFSIDELISKLQELTKPEPKFKVEQEVWFLTEEINDFDNGYISVIDHDSDEKYFVNGWWMKEEQIYPSKESLIQAQIEYWTCLKNNEKSTCLDNVSMSPPFEGEIKGFSDEYIKKAVKSYEKASMALINEHIKDTGVQLEFKCQHESDGKKYGAMEWGASPAYKCKKCAEFYR
jgi:hypothetical protein